MCIARHFQNSRRGIKRTPLREYMQWGEDKSDGEHQPRQEHTFPRKEDEITSERLRHTVV
jgi:hypothetical protein